MLVNHVIEIGTYILSAYLFYYAWKIGPVNLFIMLSATLFGYLAEHKAISTIPHPYHYPPGLINLPGPIPLDIVLGWAIIVFSVMHIARMTNINWKIQPLLAGFLAVLIDFVEDPPFVAMKEWIWTPSYPDAWFGIPWTNYVGWFLIVVCFLFSLELLYRRWPAGQKLWRDAVIAFAALVPAFIGFMVGIKGFIYLFTTLGINETLLTFLFFALAAIPVLISLPSMQRDNPLRWQFIATPIYMYFWSFFGLFYTGLYLTEGALIIAMPMIALLGMLGYLWPSLDRLKCQQNTHQTKG